MLGAPSWAGTTHVVQFGTVGADCVAGHFTQEIQEDVAERDEGAGQQRNCGTRYSQYGATHDASPTSTGWRTNSVRLFIGRPDRRPGSWRPMMAAKRLKTG